MKYDRKVATPQTEVHGLVISSRYVMKSLKMHVFGLFHPYFNLYDIIFQIQIGAFMDEPETVVVVENAVPMCIYSCSMYITVDSIGRPISSTGAGGSCWA